MSDAARTIGRRGFAYTGCVVLHGEAMSNGGLLKPGDVTMTDTSPFAVGLAENNPQDNQQAESGGSE